MTPEPSTPAARPLGQPSATAAPAKSAPAKPAPARPASLIRRFVPLAIFMVIIGGIAWLVQNMPSWRSPTTQSPATTGIEPVLRFVHPYMKEHNAFTAFWERPQKGDKQPYAKEFEQGDVGVYYFPFQAQEGGDAQLGFESKSCDCAKLHVVVVDEALARECFERLRDDPGAPVVENPAWTWVALEKNEDHGAVVPGGGFGLLRMTWENKRSPGESLNLSARIWAKQGVKRHYFSVFVPAMSTHAVRTHNGKVHVGLLEPGYKGKAEFLLWSPTRDQADLELPDLKNDPLFECKVETLDAAARASMQAKLRDEDTNTRVRSAWRVHVTVHEHQKDRWLAQGHFLRFVNYTLPGVVEEMPTLVIVGIVKGEIEIGGVADAGKIDLKSFPAKDGTRRKIYLWSGSKTELEYDSVKPGALEVKLTASGEAAANRKKWVLDVVVPGNQLFGPIGEEYAVVLRTKSTPPRMIRIPLTGHARQD